MPSNSMFPIYSIRSIALLCVSTVCLSFATLPAQEAERPAFSAGEKGKVLNYKPSQEVDYDYKFKGGAPKEVLEKANMGRAEEIFPGKLGYVMADETNRVVRVLIDSNKDKKLDFFSYYKDGVEVYREIDSNYDSRKDQFRWFGSAGTRWGIDQNQDGEIDKWKVISAEEVAFETFMAIRNRDDARYQRLLITDEEFRSLGLKGFVAQDAAARLKKARTGFGEMVRGQKAINENSKWINSGNGRPSLAPAGGMLTKDIICHDHASSVFQSGSDTDTLAIGTLVQIGDVWRLMELPQVVPRGKPIENGGVLFPVVSLEPTATGEIVDGTTEKLAEAYGKLTEQEQAIGKLNKPGVQMANLQKDRAMTQWGIYQLLPADEKSKWLENIGDTVSNGYQQGDYPDGLKFLESVIKTL